MVMTMTATAAIFTVIVVVIVRREHDREPVLLRSLPRIATTSALNFRNSARQRGYHQPQRDRLPASVSLPVPGRSVSAELHPYLQFINAHKDVFRHTLHQIFVIPTRSVRRQQRHQILSPTSWPSSAVLNKDQGP